VPDTPAACKTEGKKGEGLDWKEKKGKKRGRRKKKVDQYTWPCGLDKLYFGLGNYFCKTVQGRGKKGKEGGGKRSKDSVKKRKKSDGLRSINGGKRHNLART